MTDKATIQVKNGASPQWGVGTLFTQDGYKKMVQNKTFTWGLIAIASFILLTSLLQGEHEKKIATQIATGNILPNNIPITLTRNSSPIEVNDHGQAESNSAKIKSRTTKNKYDFDTSLGPLIIRPQNSFEVPVGSYVRAKLLTGASNGPVKAQLLDPIISNGETLVSQGATALGEGSSSEERLFIKFQKIVLPDGSTIKLQAQACDVKDQIVGLKGSKISDKILRVTGGIGLGFLSGLSQGLQDTQNVGGVVVTPPSLKNAMLNGAATASIEESQDLLKGLKDQHPIIEVPAQTEFFLLVEDHPDPVGAK